MWGYSFVTPNPLLLLGKQSCLVSALTILSLIAFGNACLNLLKFLLSISRSTVDFYYHFLLKSFQTKMA